MNPVAKVHIIRSNTLTEISMFRLSDFYVIFHPNGLCKLKQEHGKSTGQKEVQLSDSSEFY